MPATLKPVSNVQLSEFEKQAPRINPVALEAAFDDLHRLETAGTPVRSDVLALIDYTMPSTEPRLWVLDLKHTRVLYQELVAHGRNSGDNYAVHFSNQPNSLMSSRGVFLTGDTYIGKHGLSLRLEGLEKGVNDNAMARDIVIHAAPYVNGTEALRQGRLGRSWGCPAVRPQISQQLIQTVKGGTMLLAYAPRRG